MWKTFSRGISENRYTSNDFKMQSVFIYRCLTNLVLSVMSYLSLKLVSVLYFLANFQLIISVGADEKKQFVFKTFFVYVLLVTHTGEMLKLDLNKTFDDFLFKNIFNAI